jgi:tRNA (cmo5U34)-methyltransferase
MGEAQGRVARSFGAAAAGYDAARRALVPCFDALYGNALEVIADWGPPEGACVLDLGAGTGLFAAMVLDRFPSARLRLVDLSPDMLARARRRFAGADPSRVAFGVLDMAEGDLCGPWDLVVSALAIHHLDAGAKRALFARVRAALAPGGLFVNAEQVLGPGGAAEARYHRVWESQTRAAGATNDDILRARERMRHDRCDTVEDQLRWLREAGFAGADCTFKAWRFAVLAAWRG